MDIPETVVSHTPAGLKQYVDADAHPDPVDVASPPESVFVSAMAIGAGVATRQLLTKKCLKIEELGETETSSAGTQLVKG